MTDDERKLVVELCGQLSMAVTICRMDTGPFRPDESIKSWEALVKRGLALSAGRMADQEREIAKLEEALGRALEQRDALVRLVEEFRRAAGAEDASDPVGAVEDLRRRAEGRAADTELMDYLERNFDLVQIVVTGNMMESPMRVFASGDAMGGPGIRWSLTQAIREARARVEGK